MAPSNCDITYRQEDSPFLTGYYRNGPRPGGTIPVINNITGIASDGNTLTIQGLYFGNHGNTPIYYDDYRNATLGQTAIQAGLSDLGTDGKPLPLVANDQSVSGSQSLKMDYAADQSGTMFPRVGVDVPGLPSKLYMYSLTRFTRYTDDTNEQNPIMKRMRAGAGAYYSGTPGFYETDQYAFGTGWANGECGDGDRAYTQSDGTPKYNEVRNKDKVHNVWHATELYSNFGSEGNSDGVFWQRLDNIQNDNVSDVPIWLPGWSGGYEWAMSDFDGWDQYGVGAYYLWLDQWYVDNTQARVVLGDEAVYSNCTKIYVQPKTSWQDNELQISFRPNDLVGNAYLFVIDDAGNATDGYEITIV